MKIIIMHNTEVINMCIEAVWFGHKSSRKMVARYAMLDNCSQGSFIKEEIIEELEITGKKLKLSLETLMGEKSEELAAVNVLIVSGISCSKEVPVEWIEVPKAYSRSFLPVERAKSLHQRRLKKKKNFMAPFYGWGSIASRPQPLRGDSLLFSIQFPEIRGTHFIDLRSMKG